MLTLLKYTRAQQADLVTLSASALDHEVKSLSVHAAALQNNHLEIIVAIMGILFSKYICFHA